MQTYYYQFGIPGYPESFKEKECQAENSDKAWEIAIKDTWKSLSPSARVNYVCTREK